MKCEECQGLVEEYFDRELDQRTAEAVLVHIENCLSCAAAFEQLVVENRTYQSYERELDVSPALWTRVREQLVEENNETTLFRGSQIELRKLFSLRFSLAASVALVLLAVVATIAVMKYLNRQETSNQLASSARNSVEKPEPGENDSNGPVKTNAIISAVESENRNSAAVGPGSEPMRRGSRPIMYLARGSKTPVQLVREAEKKYLSAIALLTRDAGQKPSQLDSETRAKLDDALAAIDRTILSTRKAVHQNPNDPLAVQYMLSAYGKKVEVLKEMSGY